VLSSPSSRWRLRGLLTQPRILLYKKSPVSGLTAAEMLEENSDFFWDSFIENADDLVNEWTPEDWALFLELIKGKEPDYFSCFPLKLSRP
jgi:hypothetical protein